MSVVLSLLLLSLQGPKITITFPPTPLSKALQLLSEASGRHLEASPALGDEVALARLKDAPVDTALSHLAEALCSRWQTEKDGITWLVPDSQSIAKLDRETVAEDEKHLFNSLKYVQKRLASQPEELDEAAIRTFKEKKEAVEKKRKAAEAAEDYDRMFVAASVDEESPAWRALARLTLSLDPKTLLAMPNLDREVWAENPTSMQHAFNDEQQQIIKRYRRELSLLDADLMPKRVKILIQKWESGSALSAQLEVEGLTGKLADNVALRLNDDSDLMKIPVSERNHFEPKPGESLIVVPIEAQEARIALSNSVKDPSRRAILEKWKTRLLDPVHFEPTQWHVGQDLIQAAEREDRNLIGTVSDFTDAQYWKPEKLTASQVLAKNASMFLATEDGWLVVRNHEKTDRASRSKAKALIARCVDLGGISVDNAANWAAQSTDRSPFVTWVGAYLRVLFSATGPYSALSTTIDSDNLRLWASLGSSTIDRLRKGDTIQLSRLTSDSKAQIEKIVYWFNGLDSDTDPTDQLPNGISDGTLKMTETITPVFYGWTSKIGPPAVPGPMDTNMFGSNLAKGNTWWGVPAGVYRNYDRFRVGINHAYDLHFLLQPGDVPMTLHSSETFFDPNAEALSDLPPELKAATEKARLETIAQPSEPKAKRVVPPQ